MSKEGDDLHISETPPGSPEKPAFLTEMGSLASQLFQLDVPKPLECLQGSPIPPFLSKTYELVDDRSLDPIISWGRNGESFVVWDPVEFSTIILPRNFKHNNFSSFVRQLNTYGFRKIDTNRWEFANEAFRRGEKHLLRNIQRRKGPNSQQVGSFSGSSGEAAIFGLESEVDILRNERSLMMEEVVDLQLQQRGTVHHMESVHQRLQAAEQRQKQMISFLAKLFQNPAFMARLKEKKAQREIDSPRTRRKFVKHQPPEPGQSESPIEGKIVKFQPEFIDPPSLVPNLAPAEQSPDYVLQGMVDMDHGGEANPFDIGNVSSDEFALEHGFTDSRQQVAEGTSSFDASSHLLDKGKNVLIPQQEDDHEYFVSFPDDLTAEKSFPEFSGIENMVKQEDIWSTGFETSAGIPTSGSELWGNPVDYDASELATSSSFSDIWDLDSGQGAGSSGVHKWSADENPTDENKSSADLREDDRPKDINP